MRKEELLSEDLTPEGGYKIALSFDPEDEPSPLFDYTFHLAKLLNGEVLIVHALENIVSTDTEEEEKKVDTKIAEIISSLKLPEVSYKVEIIYGKDIESFAQFVEKEDIKLFAFYFFKKLLGKTLSEEFLEKLTNCGLLIVKEKQPFREIKRVLVPVDFSESSFKQKEFILRLKRFSPYGIEVVFLHVMDEEDRTEEEEIKLLFSELFEEIGELRIAYGDPAEEILKILEGGKFELAVMGRTGRGLNLDYGNVTKEVVEEAPCPVVVV